MFFWRKKSSFNKINLERVTFHKIARMNYEFYSFKKSKKKYTIKTIVRNVPAICIGNKIVARVSYNEIPETMVHFILHINNIQREYISSFNTVNLFINAKIDVESECCKNYKFELLPTYERRILECTTY